MTPYWLANIAVWTVALVIALRGAVAAAWRKKGAVRRGDPMRLAVFLVSSLFIAYPMRWLFAPGSLELRQAISVVGVVTGCYVIRLMYSYGRGGVINAEPSDG
jgi:hypothetical protein